MVLSSLSQLLSQLSALVHGSRALLVTRQCNFTSIFPQFSQLADLPSSLFFHRPSFWYTGCLQCGEYLTWVRTGYSFQVGTGCFGGISTPHLCLVQDPKPKCLYGRDKFKHYCRLIVNLGCFFVLFGRGCMNYLFPASYAWGNFSILAVGIWAVVQRDSLDAIMMVSVRVFASTQLLRERVDGRNSSFESVMIFSCSQYSSQQVKLTFSPHPKRAWILLKHYKLWWEALSIRYFASQG